MIIIVTVLIFILVVTVVILLGVRSNSRAGDTKERLKALLGGSLSATADFEQPAAVQGEAKTPRRSMMGKGMTERLSASLSAAGLSIRPSEFMAAVLGGVVFAQILAVVLFHNVLGSAAFGLLSLYAPGAVLRFMEHRRQAAFNAQIADAILMISSSLRSGFSFLRGLQMIAKEMPPPISQEFQRVVDEVNVARPLEDALADVVHRVKSYDFDLVCTAVLIQIGVGGNLADVLESIGNTIRERVQVIGEMRALTAEGKMSGMILMLMPVGVGLLLAARNPEYMAPLITEPIGHMMLAVAAVMQLMGGFIIKKMLVLDV